jgi:hypothetical protein
MNNDLNKLANRLHQALEGIASKGKTKLPAKWVTRQEIANHFQVSKDAVDAYAKKHGLQFRVEKIQYACTGLIKTKLHYLPDFADWTPLRYSNSIYWKRPPQRRTK